MKQINVGIVGTDYTVVQNEQCAEMLDRLVDEVGGAHFETAGSLRRGKSVFVTMKLPDAMEIAGITRIRAADIAQAAALGYKIRLIGLAESEEDGLFQRVQPCQRLTIPPSIAM